MKDFAKWKNSLSVDDRIAEASKKLVELEKILRVAIHLYENNRIVVFDEAFDEKVPSSLARNTLNTIRHTLVKGHFLQVCRIWDRSDIHRDSLLTICELLDSPDTLSRQHQLTTERSRRARNIVDIDRNRWMIEESERRSHEVTNLRSRALYEAIEDAKALGSGDLVRRLRDYRDRYIAHSLSSKPQPSDFPYYGDSHVLMEKTKPIVSKLVDGVLFAGVDWEADHEAGRRNAMALWANCVFNVSE